MAKPLKRRRAGWISKGGAGVWRRLRGYARYFRPAEKRFSEAEIIRGIRYYYESA